MAQPRDDFDSNLQKSLQLPVGGEVQYTDVLGSSIDTYHLRDNSVTTDKIADDAVNANKILDGNIGNTAMSTSVLKYTDTVLTAAQVISLNTTPIQLVPGATRYAIMFCGVAMWLSGSTSSPSAYVGVDANEDLVVRYNNGTGAIVGTIEATGFLDNGWDADGMIRYCFPSGDVYTGSTELSALPLVLHLTNGNLTSGGFPLYVRTFYRYIPASTDNWADA